MHVRRLIRILSPVRAALALLLVATFCYVWQWYSDATALHEGLPEYLGDALPIYAVNRYFDLSLIPDAAERLKLAIIVAIVMPAALMIAVARRWRTSVCLTIAFISVLAINISIARIAAGDAELSRPFARLDMEYFGDVRYVRDDPMTFIAKYSVLTSRWFMRLSHHAGTHPPGGVLFLWLGDKALGESFAKFVKAISPANARLGAEMLKLYLASGLAIVVSSLSLLPAYALARTVGGAAAARRMLPLYVSATNLVLFGATCMDGVFMTFTLFAMAAGFIAMRRWSIVWPIVAGALLWLATFMTYATIAVPLLMGCFTLFIGLRRPMTALKMIARSLLVGIVAVLCQLAAERWLHYDFRKCLASATRIDEMGVHVTGYESFEIWRNLSLGNGLAWLFGSGVAATALLVIAIIGMPFVRSGSRRLRAFALAVVLCMTALTCSTLFTLETERVWLFMTPPLLIAATLAFRGTLVWIIVPALLLAQALIVEWNFNTYW